MPGTVEPRDGPLAKALVCLAFFLFAASDVTAKYISRDFSVNQVIFVSATITFIPVLAWMRLNGDVRLLPRRLGLCILRSVFASASVIFLVNAFGYLPVADAYAFSFTAPLIVAALSGLLLGERVSALQWLAIVIGFSGVLILLGPSLRALNLGVLLAMASAICFALGLLLLRRIGTSEGPGSILIVFLLTTLVITGVPLLWEWQMPRSLVDWGLMAAIGFAAGGAHIAIVSAFRRAPAARLAPFQYTQLVWGVVLGIVVFGDWPGPMVALGSAIVVGAGLLLAMDERRIRASGAAAPALTTPETATKPSATGAGEPG